MSSVYESVVPDLTRLLRNTVTTTHTFESKEDQVTALFDDVAGFSGTAEQFLHQNGDNMITLANQGAQILPAARALLPGVPVLPAWRGGQHPPQRGRRSATRRSHIVLETLQRQPRGYNVGDLPQTPTSVARSRTAT